MVNGTLFEVTTGMVTNLERRERCVLEEGWCMVGVVSLSKVGGERVCP